MHRPKSVLVQQRKANLAFEIASPHFCHKSPCLCFRPSHVFTQTLADFFCPSVLSLARRLFPRSPPPIMPSTIAPPVHTTIRCDFGCALPHFISSLDIGSLYMQKVHLYSFHMQNFLPLTAQACADKRVFESSWTPRCHKANTKVPTTYTSLETRS